MSSYDDTGFLFASPSFWHGAASALDMGSTLVEYNASETPEQADARAIASDWAITGKQIETALKALATE